MLFGTLTKIDVQRGFGFVAQDQPGEKNLFFHAKDLRGGLQGKFSKHLEGVRVNYRRTTCRRGVQATDIIPANEERPAAPTKESTRQSA
jgi:cold shock CspA family protein